MRLPVKIPILDCEEHSEYRTSKIRKIVRTVRGNYFIITELLDSGFISQKGYGVGDTITYCISKRVVDEVSTSTIEF